MNRNPSGFRDVQYVFAAHLRDPANNAAPADVEERRMAIYRRLFFNNISNFIAGGFPVLRKLYGDDDWNELIRSFMARHSSQSPYFLQMSEEFLHFLQQEHVRRDVDPPFLLELAHYEWVELALQISEQTIDLEQIDVNGDLLAGHPQLSPLAQAYSYRWPVHQLGPDNRPEQPPAQATHIIIFRDRRDEVRFVLINAVTARLLALLQENPALSGKAALLQIATELQHPDAQVVLDGGRHTLEQLHGQGIIPGIRRAGF